MTETLHIYTRVSTTAQEDEGTSLDSQREIGLAKAKELGFDHRLWNEGGRSSHHEELAKRPILNSLINEIIAGNVGHLWVYDHSRLSRNDVVASLIRNECGKNGVILYTKDGQYDFGNIPGDVPILSEMHPFARLGMGFTYAEIDTRFFDVDDTGFLFVIGGGVAYPVNDHISIESRMQFNITTNDFFEDDFYFSWELISLRYRF